MVDGVTSPSALVITLFTLEQSLLGVNRVDVNVHLMTPAESFLAKTTDPHNLTGKISNKSMRTFHAGEQYYGVTQKKYQRININNIRLYQMQKLRLLVSIGVSLNSHLLLLSRYTIIKKRGYSFIFYKSHGIRGWDAHFYGIQK